MMRTAMVMTIIAHGHDAHHADEAHHNPAQAEDAGDAPSQHGPRQQDLQVGTAGYHPMKVRSRCSSR